MKKKFLAMTLASVMTFGMVSGVTCSAAEAEDLSGTITAAGSSALKPLADDAAISGCCDYNRRRRIRRRTETGGGRYS